MKTLQSADGKAVADSGEDNAVFAGLAATLTEIRKLKGVRGYILKSNSLAVVDLVESDAVSAHALLSVQVGECGEKLAGQFSMIGVESVLVEGKTAKVLCVNIAGNAVSFFMDKNCVHTWILKRILL